MGVMVDDTGVRNAWREHYSRLLNEESDWDRNSLDSVAPVQDPPPLTEGCKVKEAIINKNNEW